MSDSDDSNGDIESITLEEAMERYSNGDAKVLPIVYDQVVPRVRDYAKRRLDAKGVDIVVDEVMFSLHKHRCEYVPRAPVLPWAFSFALAAVDIVLEAQSERRSDDDATFTGQSHDQLTRLPEPMRSALELVWLEGFTPQQAADLLGTSTRMVRAWTSRAFRKLEEIHQEADETSEHDYDSGTHRPSGQVDGGLSGTVVCGHYRVGAEIGRGGMATVYDATELAGGRVVAMKVLADGRDPTDVQRFAMEFHALSELRTHPNIVEVFDEGELSGGRCFYTMERLHGKTLKELLVAEKRLDWPRTAEIVRQICEALSAVHDKGLVHRDIKPGNVFMVSDDERRVLAKLIDFGIARHARFDNEIDQLTRPGAMPGTTAYLAPERAKSVAAHARSDVYSLGITMFELLCGRRPFWTPAGDVFELAASLNDPPPPMLKVCPIADCTPEIEAIVRRAIEREPERRFQSVAELSAAITALDHKGHGELPFVPRPRAPQSDRVRTALFASAALAIGSAVGAALTHCGDHEGVPYVGPELDDAHIDRQLQELIDRCRRDEDTPTEPISLEFKVLGKTGLVTEAPEIPEGASEREICLRKRLYDVRFGTFDRPDQLIEREL